MIGSNWELLSQNEQMRSTYFCCGAMWALELLLPDLSEAQRGLDVVLELNREHYVCCSRLPVPQCWLKYP